MSPTTGIDEATLADLRSYRYVTSGYTNVFHRAFLYGMGLTPEDMRHPFVGVGVAHNEAVAGQASVKALGDAARYGLQTVGFTERSFVVPESFHSARSGTTARELVADSAELVVRGHWYDALIGVAGSPAACFGLAQAIVRLRIPGLVLIPQERVEVDRSLAAAAEALQRIGLGLAVSIERAGDIAAAARGVYADVLAQASPELVHTRVADNLRGALPASAVSGAVLGHLCALAHEVGVTDLSDIGAGALAACSVDVAGEGVVGLATSASAGEWHVVEAVDDVALLRDPTGGRELLAVAGDRRMPTPGRPWSVVVLPGREALARLSVGSTVHVRADTTTPAPVLAPAVVAGCSYPGPVDSALNYDRL